MRLSAARRLKPGAVITFGDHMYTARCRRWWQGEILHVTEKGGIKVKVVDEKPWMGPAGHAAMRGNEVRWVPYTHAIYPGANQVALRCAPTLPPLRLTTD